MDAILKSTARGKAHQTQGEAIMKNKLEKIRREECGEIADAADQALAAIARGIDGDDVYINTDPKFGVTCALTEEEIMNPATWPEDWEYQGNVRDFTPMTEWIETFED
jgi:hypothetical protein